MNALLVDGMHGLGDCLHQRALIRHYLRQGLEVWLKTPWPCLYHDMGPGPQLRLLDPVTRLRTQAKNAMREHAKYERVRPPARCHHQRVFYSPESVRRYGSVLAAMLVTSGAPQATRDFRLPIPAAWDAKALALIAQWQPTRPVMIVRPLVDRAEWSGCAARNPDHTAYETLYAQLRQRFFVVSIADLVPRREWRVGPFLPCDATYHHGELDIETVAALTARAALIFCSPGFAVPLAQAVSTPVACVFGGYESSRSFSGMPSVYLGIDPIEPCTCFAHGCGCKKTINLAAAMPLLTRFADNAIARRASRNPTVAA